MNNTVELIGHYGNDEIIALSAWTSTSRDLSEEKRERIPALIKMLWSEGHETPFEKGSVHFLVTCDISSHIHLLKHRIASINAESARYKELKEDKFYLPEDWANVHIGQDWQRTLEEHTKQSNELYHQCLTDLTPILDVNVQKRVQDSLRLTTHKLLLMYNLISDRSQISLNCGGMNTHKSKYNKSPSKCLIWFQTLKVILLKKLLNKSIPMYEIKEIKFKIVEHNPKAQSICIPDQKVSVNEFYQNIQQQLKQLYDTKRSNSNQKVF